MAIKKFINIKIDKKILAFIKAAKASRKFKHINGKAMTYIATEAIAFLAMKHSACFDCPFHKEQVAGLELGRQKLAVEALAAGRPGPGDINEWSKCSLEGSLMSFDFASHYRRTGKVVIEQAILEHLTRPRQCWTCPNYHEMRASVILEMEKKLENKGLADGKDQPDKRCHPRPRPSRKGATLGTGRKFAGYDAEPD